MARVLTQTKRGVFAFCYQYVTLMMKWRHRFTSLGRKILSMVVCVQMTDTLMYPEVISAEEEEVVKDFREIYVGCSCDKFCCPVRFVVRKNLHKISLFTEL